MNDESPVPSELPWSGERYVPRIAGNIRLEHVHRYLLAREWCRDRRVLDIACGEGYGSDMLAAVAREVHGVDVSPEAVAHARRQYGRARLTFSAGDCAAIPLTDASVDVVVSFETIEHHARHDDMMREIRRVLAPGGLLIISSPDRREYSEIPQYANPYHVKELSRAEFEALLQRYFPHVCLAGQRMKAGSLVWPLTDASAQRFAGFSESPADHRIGPLGPPLYLIALASDRPLEPLPAGMLDGGEFVWSHEHVDAFREAERLFHAHVAGIERSRVEVQAQAETAEQARAEQEALAASLREALALEQAAHAAARRSADEGARRLNDVRRDADAQLQAADTARARLTAERDRLAADASRLTTRVRAMEQSTSWRITAPVRTMRQAMDAGAPAGALLRQAVRSAYGLLPLSTAARLKVRTTLFRTMPFLFRRTAAYRAWAAYQASAERMRGGTAVTAAAAATTPAATPNGALPRWYYADPATEYVPLAPTSHVDTRIRAIAFYLPQFHPIPENDRWWGKGFTEWTNVSRGKPQFVGHYQPHLPGELGFYDLRMPEVQRRQIELAKHFGIHGFCFHHYWFAGTRLLRRPLDQLLANPDMDFPFCLCWANENWSRRWDGKEAEILIAQQHSPADDLAFIRDIEPALRDPRYIRIDGRPLLVVYRPSLLPNPRHTAERWRTYCRQAGIGDLYLVSTQAFERTDPREFGFDAAMEFAPNNMGAPDITAQMPLVNGEFKGVVYDYQYLVEYAKTVTPPAYELFRSVTPMWDNEARRPGRGAVFANASPARYREALEATCRYTAAHLPDKPFVFLNAWNEWAEGAHLEPDRRYGYAYLQATADALNRFPANAQRQPVVLVSHDAHFHGAQRVALTLAQALTQRLGFDVDILLCGDGPLRPDFELHGRVHDFFSTSAEQRQQIVARLYEGGARLALCNTSVVGGTVELLHRAGFHTVSMVHELPGLIKEHGLEASIDSIARCADQIVFPAEVVRAQFAALTGVPMARTLVRPQGLLSPNRFRDRRTEARQELRHRLGLPEDSLVILGMGYADRRKGLDLFVEAGLRLVHALPHLTMLWVGHSEAATMADAHERTTAAGVGERFLFPGLAEDPDVYFSGCDAFLMTSREDPFPLVVLHALDAEVPVVGFDGAGGFVELLRRGCGVLVPYLDASAMADAVLRLLADGDERDRLTTCGREIIDREFEFLSYARFLVELGSGATPSVSVIVPNYNYARYLPARLRSIMAQTIRPHEIIFLDDCSTDDSLEVAERILQDGTIPYRIISNQTNQGCYRQWLRGVQEASGELVWIAEADDDCAPTLLAALVPAFANRAVTLAYCQSKQIDGDGRELAPDYLAWTADISATRWRGGYVRRGLDEVTDTLIVKNTIPNVSGVLMRKPDLSAIAAELVELRNAGDWLVYAHVLERGDIAFIPTALNYHRRHQGSLTIGKGGVNLMREILLVQQYIKSRHAITAHTEARRDAHLQTTYEYLRLDAEGPGSYQEHEALRPLASTLGR